MTRGNKEFRRRYPRLSELMDLVKDSINESSNYFSNFESIVSENPNAAAKYDVLEKELSELTVQAWDQLKTKCLSYICRPSATRWWQQLFDCLNEAKGYVYLKVSGYTDIQFIPETRVKRPDLIGHRPDRDAVLEVKSIGESCESLLRKAELGRRLTAGEPLFSSEVPFGVNDRLKAKFLDDLKTAANQLTAYRPSENLRRVAFFVIKYDYDLSIGDANDQEMQSIARDNKPGGVDIVIARPYGLQLIGDA